MRHLLAAMVILLLPHLARAQCTIMATPVSFGTYQPLSAIPIDSVGSVTIRCQFFGPYAIGLTSGPASGGSFVSRRMSSAGSYLPYQLYTDPARHTVWGDGTGTSAIVAGFCAGFCSKDYSIYGRIPARQAVPPGTYVDTITVTVTF